MPRLPLAALAAVLLVAAHAPASEADPEVNGKRMSAWVSDLQGEPNARLRRVAVTSLGELAQLKRLDYVLVRGIATAVGKALRNDAAVTVRAQAADVLVQITEIVLEEKNTDPTSVAIDLTESLRVEKEVDIRRKVARLLGRMRNFGKPGVTPLTACLKDDDAQLRQAAADSLGRIGPDAKAAAGELIRVLGDKDKAVRAAAAYALGRIEPEEGEKVAAAIAPLLKSDPDVEVRQEVAASLGILNETAQATLAALAVGFADKELEVRRRTAGAYVSMLNAAKVKMSELDLKKLLASLKGIEAELKKAVTTDADAKVRMDALRALVGAYGDDAKDLIEFLGGRLNSAVEKEFEVRVAVVEELGALGANGTAALPILRKAQTDPQIKVRDAAGRAIMAIAKALVPPKK